MIFVKKIRHQFPNSNAIVKQLFKFENTIHNDINKRVGVLEKWRHVLIGGSIVIGFVLHKMMNFT